MFRTYRINNMVFRYIGRLGVMYLVSEDARATHKVTIIWNTVEVVRLFRNRTQPSFGRFRRIAETLRWALATARNKTA